MIDLGVRLEDFPDGSSCWKLDDPEELRKERDAKKQAATEAARRKLAAKLDIKRKDLEKLVKLAELPSIPEALKDKYSKFDPETGAPSHDAEGAALEGKALDKAKKDVEKQKKVRKDGENNIALMYVYLYSTFLWCPAGPCSSRKEIGRRP